jgi:hypothetical protein
MSAQDKDDITLLDALVWVAANWRPLFGVPTVITAIVFSAFWLSPVKHRAQFTLSFPTSIPPSVWQPVVIGALRDGAPVSPTVDRDNLVWAASSTSASQSAKDVEESRSAALDAVVALDPRGVQIAIDAPPGDSDQRVAAQLLAIKRWALVMKKEPVITSSDRGGQKKATILAAAVSFAMTLLVLAFRTLIRNANNTPEGREKLALIRAALRRRRD